MIHGTVNAYRNHGCRCVTCKEGHAERMRVLYADRRAKGLCVSCKQPSQQFRCPSCAVIAKRHRKQRRVQLREAYAQAVSA